MPEFMQPAIARSGDALEGASVGRGGPSKAHGASPAKRAVELMRLDPVAY